MRRHEPVRRDGDAALGTLPAGGVRRDQEPGAFFAILGEQITCQIDELVGELAGDDPPGEGYLAKVERLTAARYQAEEIIMYNYRLLTPDNEDNEPTAAGNDRWLWTISTSHGRR
jgi:hypothetical protein